MLTKVSVGTWESSSPPSLKDGFFSKGKTEGTDESCIVAKDRKDMEVLQSHAGKKARRKRVSRAKGGRRCGVPREELGRQLRIRLRPGKSCPVASIWSDVVKTEWGK